MNVRAWFAGRPKVVGIAVVAGVGAVGGGGGRGGGGVHARVGVAASGGGVLHWLLAGAAETVSVHEVRVDRRNRAFAEVIFSRPVAPQRVGEVVTDPPASLFPAIGGIWKWTTANVLRFEPAG